MAKPRAPRNEHFVFSDVIGLIPSHPDFDIYEGWTPNSWLEHCQDRIVPQCAECGQMMLRRMSSSELRFFCSKKCTTRWKSRLKTPTLPTYYRSREWPGKSDGTWPEELLEIRQLWQHHPEEEKLPYVQCGGQTFSYPTNDHPLRADRRGKRCRLPAGFGTDHKGYKNCKYHGGRTPNYNKMVVREMAEQKAEIVAMIYGTAVPNIQPDEAIMQELSRTAGHVAWLYENLQQQTPEGVEIQDRDKAEVLRQHTKLGQQPSVWIDLYFRERQHLMSVAKTAASMGIAERQIRIAEEQGALIAEAIRRFMNDPELALTPEQMVKAPSLMRRALAAIPAGNTTSPDKPTIIDEHGDPIATEDIEDAEEVTVTGTTSGTTTEEPEYPEEG